MNKEQIRKLADQYGFELKEKNYKGNYEAHSKTQTGHIISSPTLEGMKNCLERWAKK